MRLSGDTASPAASSYYGTNGAGTLGYYSLSSGDVTSITGSAGQVLANGTSGSAQTGAVTLTLAAALTGITSINGLTLTASTGTLTIANGKTLTFSNTLTFTGTDSSSVNFGAGGTVLYSGGAYVSSITGTAGQISASASTGAVTLSIPSAMTGINSITSVAASTLILATGTFGTAVTFASATGIPTLAGNSLAMAGGSSLTDDSTGLLTVAAGGSAKNVIITPSTTGILGVGATPGPGWLINNQTGILLSEFAGPTAVLSILDTTALAADNGGAIGLAAYCRSSGNGYIPKDMGYIKGGKQNAIDNQDGGYLDVFSRMGTGTGPTRVARFTNGGANTSGILLVGGGTTLYTAAFAVTPLVVNVNGQTTTSSIGSLLINGTAATAGVPVQYSPAFALGGEVWNTTATAANNWVWMRQDLRPTSGTTPTSTLFWSFGRTTTSVPGSFSDQMSLSSAGILTLNGNELLMGGGSTVIDNGSGALTVSTGAGTNNFVIKTGSGSTTAFTIGGVGQQVSFTPGSYSQAAWGVTGALVSHAGSTVTDSSTAGSGTAASATFFSFAVPTLAATNSSVTTTTAATVYIAGVPTAGTNQTITNPYGLWNVGATRLDGGLFINNSTASTSTSTGAAVILGGIGVAGAVTAGGVVTVNSTTATNSLLGVVGSNTHSSASSQKTAFFSTSEGTTASGFGLSLSIQGSTNTVSLQTEFWNTNNTGTLNIQPGGPGGNVVIGNNSSSTITMQAPTTFSVTTNATSSTTGSVIISGGLGVASAIAVGGVAYSYGAPSVTGATALLIPATTYTVTGSSTTANFQASYHGIPTFTDASAGTITNAATLWINGAPVAAGSLTITNAYSLYVAAGATAMIGSVLVGGGAVSTSATDGFLYMDTCAGTPIGTPTSRSGYVPLVYDTTNSKLYVYTSSAWTNVGGAGGSPGGSNTQIQYNSSGSFAGSANLTYASSIVTATVTGIGTTAGTSALTVQNTTNATSLASQNSPSILLSGQGWSGSATQTIIGGLQVIANGTGAVLTIIGSINGGAYSTAATFNLVTGQLATSGNLSVGGVVFGANGSAGNPTYGFVNSLGGMGAYLVSTTSMGIAVGGNNVVTLGATGITSYAGISTAGWGVPAIYGSGRSAGQTAAVTSVATYTVGAADGSFHVSANVNVTAATTANFTVTCTYTDEGNTSRTLTLTFSNTAGTLLTAITNVTGIGAYEGVVLRIRAKASTAITIATTGTFTSVTYSVEGSIIQIA